MANDCLCQAWAHMGKPAMGTKAVCYVWWVWSHLEDTPTRASGLGKAGSQEEWQSRANGINQLNREQQIWCCLCWTSEVEGELKKRKNCAHQFLYTQREFPPIPVRLLRVFYASFHGDGGNPFIYFRGF